ncbi:hypothetical protein SAMN04487897_10169 [Paenibacillus sp. yr247]|nr:hypothetical protein SAMN04487897_10169 [Paenibacillus sp. yr247]
MSPEQLPALDALEDQPAKLMDTVAELDNEATYAFALEKERSVLFAADALGNLISVYRPKEVHIERS